MREGKKSEGGAFKAPPPDRIGLNSLYHKNNEVHTHNTRAKNMFHISFGTQPFSSACAKIWNALMAQIDSNVPLVNSRNL